MSHTYAILQLSAAAFKEIETKCREAGYEHAFDAAAEGGLTIDMHGIAVQALPAPALPPNEGWASPSSCRWHHYFVNGFALCVNGIGFRGEFDEFEVIPKEQRCHSCIEALAVRRTQYVPQ